jgi:hypothetical protein
VGPKGDQGIQGVAGPAGAKGADGAFPGKVPIQDTRTINDPPSAYYSKGMGKYDEFKLTSKIGLPPGTRGAYQAVETTVPWWDVTGGPIVQSTAGGDFRRSYGPTTWGPWAMPAPKQFIGGATSGSGSAAVAQTCTFQADCPTGKRCVGGVCE